MNDQFEAFEHRVVNRVIIDNMLCDIVNKQLQYERSIHNSYLDTFIAGRLSMHNLL